MNFEQALAAMRRGEKVRRPMQGFESIGISKGYLLMYWRGEILMTDTKPAFKSEDILATDWQIVPSEADQKLHEFNGA